MFQIEPKIRLGEILSLVLLVVGFIAWAASVQPQIDANTSINKSTVELIGQMREEIKANRDMIIRVDERTKK